MNRREFIAVIGASTIAGCTGGGDTEGPSGSSGGESPAPESDSPGGGSNPATEEPTEEPTSSPTPEAQTTEVVIGEIVEDDNFAMGVRSVARAESIGQFQEADSGNEFVIVRLVIKNRHESEFAAFSSLLQTRIVDGDSYTYDRAFVSTGRPLGEGKLAPGEVSRGDIVFEVPKDAPNLQLEFDFQAFAFFGFSRVTIDLEQEAGSISDLEQTLKVPLNSPGDSDSFGGTETVLNGVETATELGSFTQADDGHEYVIVDISVTNNTGDEQHVSILGQMDLKDGQGYTYTVDVGGHSALDRAFEQGSPMEDGQTRRGKIAYQVEEGRSPLYWTFDFSLFAEGGKSFWQLR